MLKSEKANKIISLVMFWGVAFLLLKRNLEIYGQFNLIIVVLTVLYTVYQVYSIFKVKKER